MLALARARGKRRSAAPKRSAQPQEFPSARVLEERERAAQASGTRELVAARLVVERPAQQVLLPPATSPLQAGRVSALPAEVAPEPSRQAESR